MNRSAIFLSFLFSFLSLTACDKGVEPTQPTTSDEAAKATIEQNKAKFPVDLQASDSSYKAVNPAEKLDAILAQQDEETKKRYAFRHPKETLTFFGLTPGMTVLEALPGGGWYSKILAPYLGKEGKLIGVDYAYEMWPLFNWMNDEFLAQRKAWPEAWPQEMQAAKPSDDFAQVSAYTFGSLPESLNNSVDAVLFIRALHNLNRFEGQGQFLSKALADVQRVLKPGGIVGVVQHEVAETASDESATGERGYLKKSRVIQMFTERGFELVASSDINQNPLDVPDEDDIVWRLPPSLSTSKEDPELQARYQAIGESNRMTLLFKKK